MRRYEEVNCRSSGVCQRCIEMNTLRPRICGVPACRTADRVAGLAFSPFQETLVFLSLDILLRYASAVHRGSDCSCSEKARTLDIFLSSAFKHERRNQRVCFASGRVHSPKRTYRRLLPYLIHRSPHDKRTNGSRSQCSATWQKHSLLKFWAIRMNFHDCS
jgi:hypothetical protein